MVMPTYEYHCNKCDKNFSKIMTLTEHERKPRAACPKCASRKVEQLPSSFQAVTSKKS
ncbi:MAG: zinc ribbon domain-containing protein [Phycisphaerae bacterium]